MNGTGADLAGAFASESETEALGMWIMFFREYALFGRKYESKSSQVKSSLVS